MDAWKTFAGFLLGFRPIFRVLTPLVSGRVISLISPNPNWNNGKKTSDVLFFKFAIHYSRVLIWHQPKQCNAPCFRSNHSIWQFLGANHSKMTIYLLDDQASSQQPPPPTIFIRRLFFPGFFKLAGVTTSRRGCWVLFDPRAKRSGWPVETTRPGKSTRKLVVGLVGFHGSVFTA